ncbi:FAD-dependent oxidoreductase [Sphingobium sp.]|uniref:FAD-dependent oxidoreductase n=1 Tax=Sphingobium sp. TaxID=1912891 RepID=UPI002B73AAC3|nr:FAD-dependent oxidoreductase [Sphingobium sp.]HUD90615.1 FAD-dependent oxidoreductase [Sphingobium sp.]
MADQTALPVIIIGGGPAGMMAGFLFARAGVRTIVMEKHADFLRDFRGDTVHPSTLGIFDELGLLDALLARKHDKVASLGAVISGREYRVADFSRLPGPTPFVAMMPQWHFLDFVADVARRLPAFTLRMESEAIGLIEGGTRIAGVRLANGETLEASLVIAADGRSSRIREAAGLPLQDLGAPIDVLWFRVPKPRTPDNRTQAYIDRGEMIVTIDRGDYFQCARVIEKGAADRIRAAGIERFRKDVATTATSLRPHIGTIADWSDVKLLAVSLDRLTCWHRPGLLAIGDAAHAMSPVGGVGINLAIQDAVAAANILTAPLLAHHDPDPLLHQVRARRMFAVHTIQAVQRSIHRNVIGSAMRNKAPFAPAAVRLLQAVPALQAIPAWLLGFGIRREHVLPPDAKRQ